MPPIAIIKDEEAIRAQKGFYIFGRDIREVPCLRSSLLLGISSGTFAGLLSFMVTSKATMSAHIGFGTLWLAVFGYWIPCRYKFETEKSIRLFQTGEELYRRAVEQRDRPIEEKQEEKTP